MNNIKRLIIIALPLTLLGCSSLQFGSQSDVKMIDEADRVHIAMTLTMADYSALAEKVTDKMFRSKLAQSWSKKKKKPRLVLGKLRNNTDDENIRMQDIYDRITEIILGSGAVRLLDQSDNSFDYVVRSELSSTRQYGENDQELAYYKLEFKLFKLDGEMLGQWSDTIPLGKAGRRFI